MKKKLIAIIVVILIVILLGFFLFKSFGETTRTTSEKQILGDEEVVLTRNTVEIELIAKQWEFQPDTITVNKEDLVKISIKSIDVTHGIKLNDFNINEKLEPGKTVNIEFIADKSGEFSFFCSIPCGSGHGSMKGILIVN